MKRLMELIAGQVLGCFSSCWKNLLKSLHQSLLYIHGGGLDRREQGRISSIQEASGISFPDYAFRRQSITAIRFYDECKSRFPTQEK